MPQPMKVLRWAKTSPEQGEVVIRRVTYSIAGQAIAVRVTGDPVAGNNGIYYLHSDHLGSNSVISTMAGGEVSKTRFLPFGGYRSAPSGIGDRLTDRGFTGHKENRDIGLTYMNARFYVPGIGRFASADTIVPNPASPQSFNRYSYVQNLPVNFTDPSGHNRCKKAGVDCPGDVPVPVVSLQYDSNGNFDSRATWEGLENPDLLARLMLSEESYKILDPAKYEDAVGAAWTSINRMNSDLGYLKNPLSDTPLLDVIVAAGQFHGMIYPGNAAWAADPESFPTQFAVGNPNAGREAYWRAYDLAEGILNGDISDPTDGRVIYGDALFDGTKRERTAFWNVQGSWINDPEDTHLTIPQIRQNRAANYPGRIFH